MPRCKNCERLIEYNSKLADRISELEQRNNHLEERVNELASMIWKPKRQTDAPKKPGPKENHEPHNRPVPKKIHQKISLELKTCPHCNSELSGPVRTRKRYVEDIKPPEPLNTEYDINHYWCKNCKKQVSPKPKDVVPKCRFGIKTMLLIAFLRYGLFMPLNKIAFELFIIFGLHISEGSLVNALTRFTEFCKDDYDEIMQKIKEAASVYTDWTGWRLNGANTSLWDFVNEQYTLLIVRNDRSREVVEDILGEDYKGIVISDCMPATAKLNAKQQKCWVHFLRYTRELKSKEGKRLHERLKAIRNEAKSGKYSSDQMLKKTDKLIRKKYKDRKCMNIMKRLDKYRDSLFTFIDYPVSDNNNIAERGLRSSVVMRKITGGNRSENGASNHEVVMSVMDTWRKQKKDFFEEGHKIIQKHLP